MTINPYPDAANPFHKGDRLRKARESAGYYNMQSFATALGADRGTLSVYEKTGKVKPTVISAYALRTGVREEWIITGEGPMFNSPDPTSPGKLPEKITFRSLPSASNVREFPKRARVLEAA